MKTIFLLVLLLPMISGVSSVVAETEWQRFKQPIAGQAHAIGRVNNGCLIGAKPIPMESDDYQITQPNKMRYFGHPRLIDYIQQLAQKVKQQQLGYLLIGDMSMPAGGPFNGGHASHQTGLDVDIWLQLPKQAWSSKQLNHPQPINLVNREDKAVNERHWQPQIAQLIQLAASDDNVNRIFVHPAIKQQLCQESTGDRMWLRKIRPWFGHRAHMHVRLICPADNPHCLDQDPLPLGDGCGAELASWFVTKKDTIKAPAKEKSPLPLLCQQLLQ